MYLSAVGDIMLGDSSHYLGRGLGTWLGRCPDADPFGYVRPGLAEADLFFGNLESPLAADCGVTLWDRIYCGPAAAAPLLRLGRGTLLNIANNHSFEHGRSVAAGTATSLGAAGIAHVGGRDGTSTGVDETFVEAGGLRVQVLASSVIRDRLSPAVDIAGRAAELALRLRSGQAEVRIVSLHWGDEFVSAPSPRQVAAARVLVEAGAHLVLGHHPHVLQPVVRYGDALVAYSLGNFLFDHSWTRETRVGGILNVDLGADGVRAWDFTPTSSPDGRCPRSAPGADADWAQRVIHATPGGDEAAYRRALAGAARRHRLAMKAELVMHCPRVSRDTWRFLLTKRRRPRLRAEGPEAGNEP